MSIKVTMELLEHLELLAPFHTDSIMDAKKLYENLLVAEKSLADEKLRQKEREKAEAEKFKATKKAERDQISAQKAEEAKKKRSKKLAADVEKAKKWAENMEKSELKKEERIENSWIRLLKKGSKHLDAKTKEAIKVEKAARKAQVEADKAAKRQEREAKNAQIAAEKAQKKAAKEAKKKEEAEHKRTNKKSGYGIFRSNNIGKGWKPGDFRDAWDKISEEEKQIWTKKAEEVNSKMEF